MPLLHYLVALTLPARAGQNRFGTSLYVPLRLDDVRDPTRAKTQSGLQFVFSVDGHASNVAV
jgi:hypothetical protein